MRQISVFSPSLLRNPPPFVSFGENNDSQTTSSKNSGERQTNQRRPIPLVKASRKSPAKSRLLGCARPGITFLLATEHSDPAVRSACRRHYLSQSLGELTGPTHDLITDAASP